MVKGTVSLQQNGSTGSIRKLIENLSKKKVLVGIPQENAGRPDGDTINNAELLYVQSHGVRSEEMRQEMTENTDKGMKYSKAHSLYIKEHGSPMLNIPPRPVLEPAIESQKDIIGKQLAAASTAAIEKNPQAMEEALNKAGMLAESAAKGWFDNPENGWPPNAESTIKKKGSDHPLIDTGEMRKSITYVVRDKE
ncbi:hypothetical protein [Pectinatus haikarae]|uniref:Uncharacterized protein n=1 Tax=Pectinatus haikarae TaxID=349096 RepID=A0ABT9Y5L4_9FIRM|nr:hypothetical protein [Pectinatus haikarae]MDQ0202482.1 hypothetical protein [Pectinatus haikarae]